MNYLTEATINVLATSATFDRDYSIDPTPYVKSGRSNWIPAATPPTAEQLQSRKELLDAQRKIETKTEVKQPAVSVTPLQLEAEAKSRPSKPKDKE